MKTLRALFLLTLLSASLAQAMTNDENWTSCKNWYRSYVPTSKSWSDDAVSLTKDVRSCVLWNWMFKDAPFPFEHELLEKKLHEFEKRLDSPKESNAPTKNITPSVGEQKQQAPVQSESVK